MDAATADGDARNPQEDASTAGNDGGKESGVDAGLTVTEYANSLCAHADACCAFDGFTADNAKCQGTIGKFGFNPSAAKSCLSLLEGLPVGHKRCQAMLESPICNRSLQDAWNNDPGDSCTSYGSCDIPEGAYDAMCAIGFVNTTSTNHCEYQTANGGPGAFCETFSGPGLASPGCMPGLICKLGRCVDMADDGEPCDAFGKPCAFYLSCVNGTCVDSKGSIGAGEKCESYGDCAPGLWCDSSDICVAASKKGEACLDLLDCASKLDCVSGLCVRNRYEGTWSVCGPPKAAK